MSDTNDSGKYCNFGDRQQVLYKSDCSNYSYFGDESNFGEIIDFCNTSDFSNLSYKSDVGTTNHESFQDSWKRPGRIIRICRQVAYVVEFALVVGVAYIVEVAQVTRVARVVNATQVALVAHVAEVAQFSGDALVVGGDRSGLCEDGCWLLGGGGGAIQRSSDPILISNSP